MIHGKSTQYVGSSPKKSSLEALLETGNMQIFTS